jgi:hypothetical protein
MICNPVAILLENDKHYPSGLILNRIDKQVFADSICKGDEVQCIVVSNNGQFPADIGENEFTDLVSGGTSDLVIDDAGSFA